MAKNSVESEMFQEMTDTIEDGIAFGVPTLTSKALAKGLIDLRAQNKIRTGSEFEQAEKFVAAIAAKLRGDPSVLHKFIDILREEPCYDDLVQRIGEKPCTIALAR